MCSVWSMPRHGSLREGREIYNDRQGRVSTAYYRFFQDDDLIFRLPIRNVSWKLIRRVRTSTEEASYEGFDRVRKQLFNHLCQGATADVAKRMMIRSLPVCLAFGARLLIQIHDELVFEVPTGRVGWFVRRMRQVLELPPTPDFRVPIVVEPKVGSRFGELREVPQRKSRCRHKTWCGLSEDASPRGSTGDCDAKSRSDLLVAN